jgi:DNA-binding LacI/PurR family transcriptional regulator
MEDFAKVSGISRPTVSKYFHDPDSVRVATRGKIEAALERYDYRPNIFAINHNRKSTKTIGILVPYLADPFFAELVRKIERHCIDAGFWPIVFSAHGKQGLEVDALTTLQSLRPAGALIAPLGRGSDIGCVQRFAADVPTVIFDSNLKVGEAFIGSDNFRNVGLIVDYLCETGEPPCFFEMPPVNPNANKRRDAYIKSMERLGHDPKVIQVKGAGWDFERIGLDEGTRLIRDRSLPSQTILCSNDRLAVGLIAAAYQQGLRVGNGRNCALRIAGHDDHPWSQFTCPPLTTVSQDYEAIAAQSVKVLFEIMDGDGSTGDRTEVLFEGKLVLRSSA